MKRRGAHSEYLDEPGGRQTQPRPTSRVPTIVLVLVVLTVAGGVLLLAANGPGSTSVSGDIGPVGAQNVPARHAAAGTGNDGLSGSPGPAWLDREPSSVGRHISPRWNTDASTDTSGERGARGPRTVTLSQEARGSVPDEPSAERSAEQSAAMLLLGTISTSRAETLLVDFTQRVPELATPETEAQPLLHLLEYLPAQPPVVAPVTSPFGWRSDPMDPSGHRTEFHAGVDFHVPPGTVVLAPGPGTIVSVGRGGGLGLHLRIDHEVVGYTSVLAHLGEVPDEIKAGTQVRRGQLIAYSGGPDEDVHAGNAPHVHFEMKAKSSNENVDPSAIFDLYWDIVDALEAFPLAKTHATFQPYTLQLPQQR